jgi:hypothetical protein
MRKLIVKHFALDYFITIFGKKFNAPRASRVIFPLFLLTGFTLIFFTPDYPEPSPILWTFYILDLTALFFGFVYFRIWPVKWEELDESQKFQMGTFSKLTESQSKEWTRIYNKLNY